MQESCCQAAMRIICLMFTSIAFAPSFGSLAAPWQARDWQNRTDQVVPLSTAVCLAKICSGDHS